MYIDLVCQDAIKTFFEEKLGKKCYKVDSSTKKDGSTEIRLDFGPDINGNYRDVFAHETSFFAINFDLRDQEYNDLKNDYKIMVYLNLPKDVRKKYASYALLKVDEEIDNI